MLRHNMTGHHGQHVTPQQGRTPRTTCYPIQRVTKETSDTPLIKRVTRPEHARVIK